MTMKTPWLRRDGHGPTAIGYGAIAAFIMVVVIGTTPELGLQLATAIADIAANMNAS
jgi:Flp pilus assembly pilin Flp